MQILGWRESVGMNSLGIDKIVAKVDTGARTSALDATHITEFLDGEITFVRFTVNPGSGQPSLECTAQVIEQREVTDSGGHVEKRYVISVQLQINDLEWPAEVTLTDRGTMKYRMLLGRSALRKRFQVDPSRSFLSLKNASGNSAEARQSSAEVSRLMDEWPDSDEEE